MFISLSVQKVSGTNTTSKSIWKEIRDLTAQDSKWLQKPNLNVMSVDEKKNVKSKSSIKCKQEERIKWD